MHLNRDNIIKALVKVKNISADSWSFIKDTILIILRQQRVCNNS